MLSYDGLRIQNFTVIRRDHKKNGKWYFLCKCDCGKEFYTTTSSMKIVKSCGCMTNFYIRESKYKHGGAKTRLYYIWAGIKSRCYNKNNLEYESYGGRGIKMCDEWKNSFANFRDWAYKNGFDDKLSSEECSIDRIDVNGNYEPSNCRWADRTTQANNKTNNVFITHDGETHTLSEWSQILGINYYTLVGRYKKGMKEPDIFESEDKRIKGSKRQKQLILEYITEHGSITKEKAVEIGIVNPGARISELKKSGYSIRKIYKTDNGRRYAVYFMGETIC